MEWRVKANPPYAKPYVTAANRVPQFPPVVMWCYEGP